MNKLKQLATNGSWKSASYTAGSALGIGGIAYACDLPAPEIAFMVGAVILSGAAISYTKRVDKRKDCE